MQADFEDYSNRIKLNDWDGLYAECLRLKRENMEMHARDEEYKRSEPSHDRIDIKNDRIDRNYCFKIP